MPTIEFCHRCGSAVRRNLMQRLLGIMPLCSDRPRCDSISMAVNLAPPDEFAVEPDDRPEDIDDCVACKGAGEVITRQDWATGGYEVETCVPCKGTGYVGGWAPWRGGA